MPDITGFNSALSAEVNKPLSYADWLVSTGRAGANDIQLNPDSLGAKIDDWFSGRSSRWQNEYNQYLSGLDKEWELAKINDARSWEEYMSNTAFSRQMKDIENAGYNPLLALTGGAGSGAPVGSSPSGSSSTSWHNGYSKHNDQVGDMFNLVSTALRVAGFALMGFAGPKIKVK